MPVPLGGAGRLGCGLGAVAAGALRAAGALGVAGARALVCTWAFDRDRTLTAGVVLGRAAASVEDADCAGLAGRAAEARDAARELL
jgi:hypothetical protein